MTVLIGTSGFSYKDWVGPVYPKDLPKQEWLNYYASEFRTNELNFSYYRIPNARTLDRMADKVPEGFLFSIKAYKGITHERDDPEPQIEQFKAALTPLIDAEKFACVLAQFPYSFHDTPANRDYLKRIREGFGDLPVVVEFRSREWINEQIFDELRALKELIVELKELLESRDKRMEIVRDELTEIMDKYGDPRRTEIIQDYNEFTVEDMIAEEDMVITISHTGYIKRFPVSGFRRQARGGKGARGHCSCPTKFN